MAGVNGNECRPRDGDFSPRPVSALWSRAMSWVRVASILGFLGVAFGAFGAHALRGKVSDSLLSAWQTGVLYHLVHTVALLSLALYSQATKLRVHLPAGLFSVGILLFSGSLYLMALTGVTRLGIVTPFGGLSFLAGWVAAAVVLSRPRSG